MAPTKKKMDTAELAHYVMRVASGELQNEKPVVNEAAVRRGTARASKLSKAKRRSIAKKGAAARWGKKGGR